VPASEPGTLEERQVSKRKPRKNAEEILPMSRICIALCLTLLTAGTSGVEAGGRKHRGCGVPAYSCAAPLTCAAPVNCAMPSCAVPLSYGCAAPSCAAPLSCAAPANCAVPSYAGPSYAASYGGYEIGYGGLDGMIGGYPFGGPGFVMRYPTRGITPAVIPGDEIVW
jgi:hypothetical protein